MKAINVLVEEHGGIRVILKVMAKISEQIAKNEPVDQNDLKNIIEFLQVFVDKCHHTKEENFLFPEVGKRIKDKLILELFVEHENGRQLVKKIQSETENLPKLREYIGYYITLLDKHIDKENNRLFKTADQVLSGETQDYLFQEFERIEKEEIGEGRHEEYHKMIDQLKNKYL